MLALIRFVTGRRLGLLVLLAALAAVASPALRERCARLLACGVSIQPADLFGGGVSVIGAATGGQAVRGARPQCVREAMHTAAAARSWVQRRSRAQ